MSDSEAVFKQICASMGPEIDNSGGSYRHAIAN
jgi:hypothetical protein